MNGIETAGVENGVRKGVQFRPTVSLGNIIHIGALVGMGLIGWTALNDRQMVYERTQAEQAREIREVVNRQQIAAELNAREAAIVDELEKRINHIEQQIDGKALR